MKSLRFLCKTLQSHKTLLGTAFFGAKCYGDLHDMLLALQVFLESKTIVFIIATVCLTPVCDMTLSNTNQHSLERNTFNAHHN